MVHGLGICLPVAGRPGGVGLPPAALADVVAAVEAAGATGIWLAEDAAPGPGPDAVTVAGAVARWTRTCTVGVVADLRRGRAPSLLAKEVTAIDVLSHGRAALAVGWGWPGAAHRASSVPGPVPGGTPGTGPWPPTPVPGATRVPAGSPDPVDVPAGAAPIGTEPTAVGLGDRARWVEEAATVCRGMWRQPAFTFTGRHVAVTDAVNHPGPRQPGGPPLLLALPGRARALATAARLGAGLLVPGRAAQVVRTAVSTGAPGPPLVSWRTWLPGEPVTDVAADVASLAPHVQGIVVALPATGADTPAVAGGPVAGTTAAVAALVAAHARAAS